MFNFIKSESLAQVFSCEFCEIRKNTFSAEHDRMIASDCYSNIKSSERRICDKNLNYNKKTKTYVPIWDRSVQKSPVLMKF